MKNNRTLILTAVISFSLLIPGQARGVDIAIEEKVSTPAGANAQSEPEAAEVKSPQMVTWAIRGTSRIYYFARQAYAAGFSEKMQPLGFFYDPDKHAFRAGWAYGDQWQDMNVGHYSVATGYNTTARGWYSTALGALTAAQNDHGTALGYSATASGFCASALGKSTVAKGDYSIAMGYYSEATGENAVALGTGTTASGDHAIALGDYTTASGGSATATGRATIASGNYATAMGHAAIAEGDGALSLGSWVTAEAPHSIIIGTGRSKEDRFVNDIPNSLMVGFNTNQPTLFVGGDKIGIGTATPARQLHVKHVLRLEPLREPPLNPQAGDLFFSSQESVLKCYDGTAWRNCF